MSIQNTLSFIRILNGISPWKCKFSNPVTEDQFELPWQKSSGVNHLSFDLDMEKSLITPVSKQDIMASYIA
jgi:hypothetical protein